MLPQRKKMMQGMTSIAFYDFKIIYFVFNYREKLIENWTILTITYFCVRKL